MKDWLPSWAEGDVKRSILNFVQDSANVTSESFIPVEDRIAAFDNDGTLWVEKPMPIQAPFLIGKLVEQLQSNPALASEQPYSGIASRDQDFLDALGRQEPEVVASFLKGVGSAWEGTSPRDYDSEVVEYLATHSHERFDRPHTELIYRPMMELLDLLRAHDWRIFVCSGGGRDFMRVIAEETWGIFKENVIGSAPEFVYRDGALVRENAMRGRVALGPGKPEHIFARAGRLPKFGAGNGDVDIEMLEVADFALVVVHDDADREYAYTDAAEGILEAGDVGGWSMASMKHDWVYVFDEAAGV